MRNILALTAVLFFGTISALAQGQLPDIGIQSNLALGVVESAGAQKLSLKTKDGPIDAVLQSFTVFKRLSPDNLKLSAAKDSALADISPGDRVLVTGEVSEDKSTIYANKVFLVKGSDLEEQVAKQRQEWQTRGIAGKVSAIDAANKTISVKTSSVIGEGATITLSPKDDVKFLKYSEESARYSDAIPSTFTDVHVGDNIQALGDKSEDGVAFSAEEVITGSFITIAGTVKSVDGEKNEVTISDLSTKQDITVVVNKNSLLKEFPEEVAQRLAMFIKMGGAAAAGSGNRGGGGEGGRGPGGGRGRMGDINQMLSRFPTITVTNLKVGDLIAVSSPKPKDPSRVTAIKLLAGVGPFLSAKSSSSGGSRGVSGSLNVPGLDGPDF